MGDKADIPRGALRNSRNLIYIVSAPMILVGTFISYGMAQQPTEWPDLATLNSLGAQLKANYTQIKTWQGTFEFNERDYVQTTPLEPANSSKAEMQGRGGVWKHDAGTIDFAVDAERDSRFVRYESRAPAEFKPTDGANSFTVSALPYAQTAVVTPENYLEFQHLLTLPNRTDFPPIKSVGENGGRMAARRPAAQANQLKLAVVIDPFDFFGSDGQLFWKKFESYGNPDKPRETKDRLEDIVEIKREEVSGGEVLAVSIVYNKDNPDHSQRRITKSVFSSIDGFQPSEWTISLADGQIINALKWKWEKRDGIYVPVYFKRQRHSPVDGSLLFEREMVLNQCILNQEINADMFSYRSLALAEGERFLDTIENRLLVILNGELVDIEKFNKEYSGPVAWSTGVRALESSGPNRSWLIVINVAVIVAIISLLIRRTIIGRSQ